MSGPFVAKQITLFQPISIPGCSLWLDASDTSTSSMSLSGLDVTTWKDKSGNGNATTTSVGPVPLIQNAINGLSAIQTSSGHYFYMEPLQNPANTTTVSAFVVSSAFSSANTYGRILSFGKVSDGTNNYDFSTVPNFIFCRDNTNQAVSIFRNGFGSSITTPITYTVPFLMEAVFDGTTCYGLLNGSQFNTFASSGTFSFDRFGIGVNIDVKSDPSDVYSGNIGEILVFYSALTTSQREQIEGYLAWKWGLVSNLPSTHPYKSAPVYTNPPFPLVPRVASMTNNTGFNPTPFPYAVRQATQTRWSPTQISGMNLWFDAGDTSTLTFSSGSNISVWNDKSGNGYNATQVNSPTYNSSTKAVTFNNASAQYFNLPDNALPSGNSSYAYFIVFSYFTNGAYGLIGGGNYGSGNQVCAIRNDGSGKLLNYWWANDFNTTNTMTLNTPQIGETFYTSGAERSISMNFTGSNSGTPGTRSQGIGNNTLGKTYSAEYHNGTISEMIVYTTEPILAQKQKVEGYLAWKWGFQALLPGNHPYKLWPPSP